MREINVKNIIPVLHSSFSCYGRIIDDIDCSQSENLFSSLEIPSQRNIYYPSIEVLEKTEEFRKIQAEIFGDVKIQAGYCNGVGDSLNALEYHKSSEVILAITDLVLILGKYEHIDKSGNFDTSCVECFLVSRGMLIELYPLVLHFAPCKVGASFKSMIILPRGTNEEIEQDTTGSSLFKRNKWLLAHQDASWLIEQGAEVLLIGQNVKIVS